MSEVQNGSIHADLDSVVDRKSSKSKHHKKEKHKHDRKHKSEKRHKDRSKDRGSEPTRDAEPSADLPLQAGQAPLKVPQPNLVTSYDSGTESGEIAEEATAQQSSRDDNNRGTAAAEALLDREAVRKRSRAEPDEAASPPRKVQRSTSREAQQPLAGEHRKHERSDRDRERRSHVRDVEGPGHSHAQDSDRRPDARGSSVASHRSRSKDYVRDVARDSKASRERLEDTRRHRDSSHHDQLSDRGQDRHRSRPDARDMDRNRPSRRPYNSRNDRSQPHLSYEERMRVSRDADRYRSYHHAREHDRGRADHGQDRALERDRDRDRDRGRRRSREHEATADKAADEALAVKVAAALEGDDEEDEDRLIEERRRRRAEIQRKHEEQQRLAGAAAAPTASEHGVSPQHQPADSAAPAEQPLQSPTPPAAGQQSLASSPSAGALPGSDGEDALQRHQEALGNAGEVLAGSESENEEMEIVGDMGQDFWQKGPGVVAPQAEQVPTPGDASPTEQHHKLELQNRRIADLDIFADDVAEVLEQSKAAVAAQPAGGANPALQDNYDDAEGYYNFQVGEVLDGRYEVRATHGKGVFSTVLLAKDRSQAADSAAGMVAIKVIRAIDTMTKAARLEIRILDTLQRKQSSTGSKSCIRMLGTFAYRGHTCLVFEPMALNLRELVRKYGRNIGLNLKVVRIFAYQLLRALSHMRTCAVLHADIKPDNILTDASQRIVKICDFGSAMLAGDNEITPYLVSRFYRSPEVILGLKYDYPMDMWAIGCTIYELYKGEILFPGHSNNEMLSLMMDLKGPFPKKMLKKGAFSHQHFENDPNMSFARQEIDKVTNHPVRRVIGNPTVKRSMADRIMVGEGERKKLRQLADLLEQMLQLDPERRISIHTALKHPFIKEPFSD